VSKSPGSLQKNLEGQSSTIHKNYVEKGGPGGLQGPLQRRVDSLRKGSPRKKKRRGEGKGAESGFLRKKNVKRQKETFPTRQEARTGISTFNIVRGGRLFFGGGKLALGLRNDQKSPPIPVCNRKKRSSEKEGKPIGAPKLISIKGLEKSAQKKTLSKKKGHFSSKKKQIRRKRRREETTWEKS